MKGYASLPLCALLSAPSLSSPLGSESNDPKAALANLLYDRATLS